MKGMSVLLVCLAAITSFFAQAEPQPANEQRSPVIRALDFRGFQPVKIDAILHRLKAKGVHLAVERPFDSQELVAAKQHLEGLLAENGRHGARVRVDVTPMPPRSVKVTFTAVTP